MLSTIGGDIRIVVAKGITVPLGKLVDAQVLDVTTAQPLDHVPPEGARTVEVTFRLSNNEVVNLRRFMTGYRRYLGLRQQHKHKRRAGWRHIK